MADAWGIEHWYDDAAGRRRATPADTRRALREAMHEPPDVEPVRVLRPGQTLGLHRPATLVLEDRTERTVEHALPRDLPLGYHEIRREGAPTVHLVVSPGRCFLPDDLRAFGWAVQLATLRSARSWGVGDLADLRALARWSRETLGLDALLVSPLGAPTPGRPQERSPYLPGSRRFLNPLHLAIEEVPGAECLGAERTRLAADGEALNRSRWIDRDAVALRKKDALERIFAVAPEPDGFARWRRAQGRPLEEFATFCALTEVLGKGWSHWPAEHRRPDAPGVRAFAQAAHHRVRFHGWVQWCLDEQLRRAGQEARLVHDLPIGVDPGGPDAWAWQDVLAEGVRVGAPPDEFNTRGQDWGLPPFDPHALRAVGLRPFVETVRACLRHAGGLRIDHAMGLFRLFWIPRGASPADGGYVRYPADELLAVIALESVRARAVIVGEDLGTVEPSACERLADARVLSYRLLWFVSEAPSTWPGRALAAVTTHDLPTVAGLWTGNDLRLQHALGLEPNDAGTEAIRRRLRAAIGLGPDAALREVIVATHRLLGTAPCHLVTATLEDALAVEERPNMPGTTRPENWSRALPLSLEEIRRHPLPRAVAAALRGADG